MQLRLKALVKLKVQTKALPTKTKASKQESSAVLKDEDMKALKQEASKISIIF